MRYILGLFFMLCSLAAQAQAEQKVQVMEYNLKQQKTPMAGVSLTVNNAGATMTDAQGNAVLRFRSLRPGDKVTVRRIEKAGYEVFNQEALDQWSVSANTTFTIILCRSDRFRQLVDNYTRVSSASYEAQYKKELARMEAERKQAKLSEENFNRQKQELDDRYAEQLEHLDNYIDRFARIDLSAISAEEQAIIDLVQEGRTDEAIAKYEEMDLLGKYRQQSATLRQITSTQDSLQVIKAEKEAARDSLKRVIDLMKTE